MTLGTNPLHPKRISTSQTFDIEPGNGNVRAKGFGCGGQPGSVDLLSNRNYGKGRGVEVIDEYYNVDTRRS